ncbi:Na/Pi cotransporter family protein [Paraburkholderia sp. Tr-20389]|uniref:Na/Pi cotransporter family protein n=1 Tax=Paraburkholderia sp. Tr-20389 TaxID=2703903 RepID=UPI001981998B|nr:Na/Pi symporter [Paraburkholderia sp. Tr-20389]MBN3757458.1 Na/Pi cotransporter family protein [Paraburkholderia sp. Tr-20389]
MPLQTFTLIDLAGSVALLLLGMQMFQNGMNRTFSPVFEPFLLRALRDRGHAFLGGLGVSTIQQSSTVMGWMTERVAITRPADLAPPLAAVLGANIGATLVVQILLVVDQPAVSPALILAGVLMFRKASNTRAHDLGRAFIGLGLMLLGLHALLDLMTDYEDAPSLRMVLGAASTMPVVDMLLAASLSWAAESNVAAVLLIASLCAKNVVPPDTAFALVLGANLGTAARPVLDRAAPGEPSSRRVPAGILLMLLMGVGVALAALVPIGRLIVVIEPDNGRVVADFHTLFNVLVAMTFMPLLVPYSNLLTRLMPAWGSFVDPSSPCRELRSPPELSPLSHESTRTGTDARYPSGEQRAVVRMRQDILDNVTAAGYVGQRLPATSRSGDKHTETERPPGSATSDTDLPRSVIIRDAGRNALEWLRDDGSISTFKLKGSIWLHLQDLRVVRQLEPIAGSASAVLSTSICGMASLDDGELSIIGEPWLATPTVHVTFTSRQISSTDHDGLRSLQETLGMAFSDIPLGTARLGFNRSDKELHEPALWWASLNVPTSCMDGLKEAIETGRLSVVRLGLCVSGVYAYAGRIAGLESDAQLLLRPDSIDASDSPQMATGYVTHLAFDQARVSLEQFRGGTFSSHQ